MARVVGKDLIDWLKGFCILVCCGAQQDMWELLRHILWIVIVWVPIPIIGLFCLSIVHVLKLCIGDFLAAVSQLSLAWFLCINSNVRRSIWNSILPRLFSHYKLIWRALSLVLTMLAFMDERHLRAFICLPVELHSFFWLVWKLKWVFLHAMGGQSLITIQFISFRS
jgi:hypothetical protein